jgi:hypothetical protein
MYRRTKYDVLDTACPCGRCWLLDAGCWILDTGCLLLEELVVIPDSGNQMNKNRV